MDDKDNIQEAMPESPADVERKRVLDLINKGYSSQAKFSKGLSGSPRHRGFKAPRIDNKVRLSKARPGQATKSATIRLPTGGRVVQNAPRLEPIFNSLEIDINKYIPEKEMNQVDKLLDKSKKMKEKQTADVPNDFEISKTMTGNSANTNVVEINPGMAVSSRLQNIQ